MARDCHEGGLTVSKKHKRHKLSSAWSPYGKGYVPKWKPVPSQIDVQGGEALKPMTPAETEQFATATMVDSDDWGTIE